MPLTTPTATVATTPPPTVAGTSTPAPRRTAPTPIPIRSFACLADGCFDVQRAMAHDRVLATDIGPRAGGSDAYRRAAQYVRSEFEKLGLHGWLQPFALPQGGEAWNAVAVPDGVAVPADAAQSASPDRPYILVGGHLDTVPSAPGGNDNGSGIAAMLEMARAMHAQPPPLPVVYVAFGAEEAQPAPGKPHHIGSRAYVPRMSVQARVNLVAMLNVDMVGINDHLVFGTLRTGPQEATKRLVQIAAQLGIPGTERVTPDWSDHGTFLEAGMNAGWVWSDEDDDKHTPRDTYEHVQPASVDKAGRVALAFVHSYGP